MVWLYDLAWTLVLGSVRLVTERFLDYRTAAHLRSAAVVNAPLHPNVKTAR